ncbi:hypothetical protein PFLUV_G00077160 [Perca fluviatilis]|uniref:Thyroxine-binding globulin n=1 Tax=Perca fluviatilis TaxID=8168 RepID=A0A6A5EKF8_PERFL|nr:hypothetical protein PFLUV_G00077160 [Perca fluviatilis]
MMMRAAVGLWVLSAVICVGSFIPSNNRPNSVSLVNKANQEFSFRLYRKLAIDADSQGKNIFFSPFCASTALAALSVGAQGPTHRQLFSGLAFSSFLTQTDVDQAFQTFLQRANNPSQEDTSEGTAVFVDICFKPKPEFLQTLKQSYFTDVFNVDFTNATESADTINKYVAEKTNGKIDQLVENLDPNTVLYLISYIYYKGKWATPFDPELTKQDDFNVDENTKVVHQATLDVDEIGATAAAATGINIGVTAIRFPVPVPVLKFNRPFMVIIIERNTEEILFMGKMNNPTI